MKRFLRIIGEEWPKIELLIIIDSHNLIDGEYKLEDLIITGISNDTKLKIVGTKFSVISRKVLKK